MMQLPALIDKQRFVIVHRYSVKISSMRFELRSRENFRSTSALRLRSEKTGEENDGGGDWERMVVKEIG
ncbi:hypothetical protein ACFX13_035720 [Malus domestica]